MHAGENHVADSGQADRHDNQRARAVAVHKVAGDRAFQGALRAREGEDQRGRGAVEAEVLAQRQEEDGESVVIKSAAEYAQRRADGDHAPAVE
jgi:hypothetical protein